MPGVHASHASCQPQQNVPRVLHGLTEGRLWPPRRLQPLLKDLALRVEREAGRRRQACELGDGLRCGEGGEGVEEGAPWQQLEQHPRQSGHLRPLQEVGVVEAGPLLLAAVELEQPRYSHRRVAQ